MKTFAIGIYGRSAYRYTLCRGLSIYGNAYVRGLNFQKKGKETC